MLLSFRPLDVFSEPVNEVNIALEAILAEMNKDYMHLLTEGRGHIPKRRINGSDRKFKVLLSEKGVKAWFGMTGKKDILQEKLRQACRRAGWKDILILEKGDKNLTIILVTR